MGATGRQENDGRRLENKTLVQEIHLPASFQGNGDFGDQM
jgi:hypothetical protein